MIPFLFQRHPSLFTSEPPPPGLEINPVQFPPPFPPTHLPPPSILRPYQNVANSSSFLVPNAPTVNRFHKVNEDEWLARFLEGVKQRRNGSASAEGNMSQHECKKGNANDVIDKERKIRRLVKRNQRRKKERIQKRIQKKNDAERREKLNREIDEKLHQQRTAIENKKEAMLLKKNVDEIFSEVRKKVSMATNYIQLFKTLSKLIDVRQKKAKGITTCVDFQSLMRNVTGLWEKQLKDYEKEKITLKAFTAVDAQKSLRQQSELPKDDNTNKEGNIQMEELEKQIRQIESCYFGDQPSSSDALFPYWKEITKADRDPEALADIRKSWDFFIAPPSSSKEGFIPIGWIIPSLAHGAWRAYDTGETFVIH